MNNVTKLSFTAVNPAKLKQIKYIKKKTIMVFTSPLVQGFLHVNQLPEKSKKIINNETFYIL